MKEYDLNKLLSNSDLVEGLVDGFIADRVLIRQDVDAEEIKGHILKSEHNLRFVSKIASEFVDWAITGIYYSCYHAALALIQSKGYSSKNHLATLCVMISEFCGKELSRYDIEMFSGFLDHKDVLFYVESKNKREDATYSTKTLFNKKEVEHLRIQAVLFVNKIKGILYS